MVLAMDVNQMSSGLGGSHSRTEVAFSLHLIDMTCGPDWEFQALNNYQSGEIATGIR